jgi:hypothetical protein
MAVIGVFIVYSAILFVVIKLYKKPLEFDQHPKPRSSHSLSKYDDLSFAVRAYSLSQHDQVCN